MCFGAFVLEVFPSKYLIFSSHSFRVSALTFKSLVHFQLILGKDEIRV